MDTLGMQVSSCNVLCGLYKCVTCLNSVYTSIMKILQVLQLFIFFCNFYLPKTEMQTDLLNTSVNILSQAMRQRVTNLIVRDSLAYHNNMKFTTPDQDNDEWGDSSCATLHRSAGWFNLCFRANPNGQYTDSEKTGNPSYVDYISWYYWKNSYISLKSVQLMIRSRT